MVKTTPTDDRPVGRFYIFDWGFKTIATLVANAKFIYYNWRYFGVF